MFCRFRRQVNLQLLGHRRSYVERILEDEAFAEVQPEAGYRKSFWRKVLSVLEEGVKGLQSIDPEAVSENQYR